MKVTNSAEHKQYVYQLADQLGLSIECFGHGKLESELAVIGEYPGHREVKTGIPFSGGSGQLLWSALQPHHIRRGNTYCTNVIKRMLPSDEKKRQLPGHEEAYWFDLLHAELRVMPRLKYILILGNRALYAILKEKGINNWHGSIVDIEIEGRQIRCVCANNPAAVMHNATEEVVFRYDVAKISAVMTGKYKPYEITAHYDPDFQTANKWLDHLENEVSKGLPLSYDIETISGETACFGFATDPHEGFCFNFRTRDDNLLDPRQEVRIRHRIQSLLCSRDTRIVAQNGNFDSYWVGYKDKMLHNPVWFDTLLAHHTLYPGLPHNLGFIVSQYTYHPFYKDEKDEWREGGDIHTFWEYNVKDACLTLESHRHLHRQLKEQKLDTFFFNHVMRLQPHLTPITLTGIKCDLSLREKIEYELSDQIEEKMQEFHKLVYELTGDTDYRPNPGSWQQMQELYFRRLKLVGRGMSTNADNRYKMRSNPTTSPKAQEMLMVVDDLAEMQKFYGTYAKMRTDADGRIRTEYKQYGTTSAPGRLSSAAPLWGTGMNFQNQPEKSQPMFIADEGYEFGYFDLSQAEARFVGWDAELEDWMRDFEKARLDSSYDCHRALAATMFSTAYDEVPAYDRDENGKITIRFIAKRCRHGLNYRMGADRLATTTRLPILEATQHFNTYHRVNPGLRKWWDKLEREFKDKHCLYNAYGRRLIHLGRMDENALRSIVAFRPQSSIGDHVNRVIYRSHEDAEWPIGKARIMLNIHDALIVLSHRKHTKTCLSIMKKYAEEPLMIHGRPLIIPAETKISQPDEQGVHRWSTLKTVHLEKAA